MTSEIGCTWVTGRTRRYDALRRVDALVPIHCNKLPALNDTYCPKHRLVANEMGEHQREQKPHKYEQQLTSGKVITESTKGAKR